MGDAHADYDDRGPAMRVAILLCLCGGGLYALQLLGFTSIKPG